MRYVRRLDEVGRHDGASAGGKGANLGGLIAGGFPVPDGFVVTTAGYDAYVAANGIVPGEKPSGTGMRAQFERPIPQDLADEIAAAYAALGEPTVAVRSSATAEDLAEASFAGQQDTYLGLTGAAAVLDGVRRCWASLWTDRAIAYRSKAGVAPDGLSLAVVVQRLVDAEAAGVMFTANPANGRRDEVVLDAAFGLGEAVVGGAVTPDELVVTSDRVTSRTTADKAVRTVRDEEGTHDEPVPDEARRTAVLTDAQALSLAALGRRIEQHFGAPQDIEWALADGQPWIVQSRPITALPAPTAPVPTEWPAPRTDGMFMRASIVEQLPDPLSPLFADLIRPAVGGSLRKMLVHYFDANILREGDMDFPTINGYGYYFYSNAGMRRLFLSSLRAMKVAYGSRSELNGIKLWRRQGHPDYRRAVEVWKSKDEKALRAGELLDGAAALVTAGSDYYTTVQAVIPQSATAEITFTKAYDALVRRAGKPPAIAFLLGFESEPIRAEQSLYALATWCRATPGVAEAVLVGAEVPDEHRAELDARLGAHLARYGHLTYNLDIMQPVAADDPAPVLAALKYAVSGAAVDPEVRMARLARERGRALRWLEANTGRRRRKLLTKALRKAQELGPLREDALADIGLGWPTIRRFVRELGRRFADAGLIAGPDDVFWLRESEVRAAGARLDGGEPAGDPLVDVVVERKAIWRGQRLVTPPSWLPASGVWYAMFRRFLPSNETEQTGPTLKGLGASAGRATGPARLLLGPEDFGAMRPGDVLVAPITTPAYTPFFAMASAVVTDVGGPLSHSSIVAREYGIPAVLGTGCASTRIHDGDIVTVDGDRGQVLLPE